MLPCNELPIWLTYAALDLHSVKCNALNSGKSNSQNLLIRAVCSPYKELFARYYNDKYFFRKIRRIMLFVIKKPYYFQKNMQNGYNSQNLLPQNAVSLGYWTVKINFSKMKVTKCSKDQLSLRFAPKNIRNSPTVVLSH